MNKKTLGIVIIGVAITLFIAFIPLLILGERNPGSSIYSASNYDQHLSGYRLFKYILFIGLSLVTMIALKYPSYQIGHRFSSGYSDICGMLGL
jgi:hypothetical protein